MCLDYAPKSHAVETMVVYLLNVQEWAFLSDLDIRGAKEAMDYREVIVSERTPAVTIRLKEIRSSSWGKLGVEVRLGGGVRLGCGVRVGFHIVSITGIDHELYHYSNEFPNQILYYSWLLKAFSFVVSLVCKHFKVLTFC
jgi:hypothetical protein